jgi:hypothetical protein
MLCKEQQEWACRQLCEVYAEQVKDAVRDMTIDPLLEACARAHSTLQGAGNTMIFLNEHACKKGAKPELLSAVRSSQRMLACAEVCRNSICYMMAAKLHQELSEVVGRATLWRASAASCRRCAMRMGFA